MRNLVLCSDGTWNTPDQLEAGLPAPTNVVKLYNLCIESDAQRRYYHPGVGAEGSLIRRLLAGGIGTGLDQNIKSAYHWLCSTYRPEDRIYLFGFSRGAYTVRSLSGLILRCGLLDLSELTPAQGWARVDAAYRLGYRQRRPRSDWGAAWPVHLNTQGVAPDIHFIGVWDTVGARGVPDDLVFLDLLLDRRRNWDFHDTRLSPRVRHAYHAVALDEPRASFAPTLWTLDDPRPPDSTCAQRWFPGCHSDVGGGYLESGLADIALEWMAEQAVAQGLQIDERLLSQLRPDPRAGLHNVLQGIWRFMRTLPRAVPQCALDNVDKSLHPAAWQRHSEPPITQSPYRPSLTLDAGQSWTGRIYAQERWNETGLWLEETAGYAFEAEGEWLDWYNRSGPEGMPNVSFWPRDWAYRLGDLLGLGEKLYKSLLKKPQADWWGTKRFEEAAWFALVGMVANQADVDGGGSPPRGQCFAIHNAPPFRPTSSGYLYCYANDAWRFYGNNRGSLSLRVTRLPD
ncbi:DUF2235 domain-containing protein [Thiocystis violacea]|uniref:DUF2235 domain-containing protein n=1 Tax=Thiocystis violacea TaxID=13725 RepID=UPI0019039783|nr:DUF2235 domain-containing protein [Thiocystis violacea]MBK1722287.1 hypothetical protein [Thiocystis violacea]